MGSCVLEAQSISTSDVLLADISAFTEPCRVTTALPTIVNALLQKRKESWDEWRNWVQTVWRDSPLQQALMEDPFTSRSFARPRSYPGDAVLLDLIYKHPSVAATVANSSDIGKAIYAYTSDSPAPRAVRNRRTLLAKQIDREITEHSSARILSLACGHIREATQATLYASDRLARFLAIDQDVATLETVAADYRHIQAVHPQRGSVRQIIGRGIAAGCFDFIYAAGLYDYLPNGAAIALTRQLFGMLRSGGKLWVANFVPDIPDRGYMEACMDWWLTYRTAEEMESLLEGISPAELAAFRTFLEPEENIVFLEAQRI